MNKFRALIEVRKLVALSLTALFIVMALRGQFSPESAFTVIVSVISYYFGKTSKEEPNQKDPP